MNARLLNAAILALAATVALPGGSLRGQSDLLSDMSAEQVQALIARAIQARLEMERDQAAAEIRRGLLYDGDDIDRALALLDDRPANTQADNIDRICRALAIVDLRFDRMTKLRRAGKYAQAAVAAKAMIQERSSTYLSAAQHFLCADSLVRAGKWQDGVEVYGELLTAMPDRISFAAEAAVRSAEAYEKNGRFRNAMEMYAYCVRNYGLALDKSRLAGIMAKIEKYGKLYKAPLKAAADMMGLVQRRLESVDSGRETRKKQDEIIALLDDLIKTAEEQQQRQSQGSGKGRQRGRQKSQGRRGKGAKGRASGGTQQPSSPMRNSSLPPGVVRRPPKDASTIRPTNETGDWARLPPREKQQIEQVMRKLISQRYRSAISDYHTRMAEDGNTE